MNIRKILFCIMFASGCASTWDKMQSAHARKDYHSMCEIAAQNMAFDSDAMAVAADCYEEGIGGFEKNHAKAINLLKLSARHGNRYAISELIKQGIEVPYPDIQAQQQQNEAAFYQNMLLQQNLAK